MNKPATKTYVISVLKCLGIVFALVLALVGGEDFVRCFGKVDTDTIALPLPLEQN